MNGRKTFSKALIKNTFKRLESVSNYNPSIWRRDSAGMLICFPSYGDRNSSYGWNIHHIDGNKENNRESNLIAVHYTTHELLHAKD